MDSACSGVIQAPTTKTTKTIAVLPKIGQEDKELIAVILKNFYLVLFFFFFFGRDEVVDHGKFVFVFFSGRVQFGGKAVAYLV